MSSDSFTVNFRQGEPLTKTIKLLKDPNVLSIAWS